MNRRCRSFLPLSLVALMAAAAPLEAQLEDLLKGLLGGRDGKIEKAERLAAEGSELRYRVHYRDLSSSDGVVLTARLLDTSLQRVSGFEILPVEIRASSGDAELSIRFTGDRPVRTTAVELRLERDGRALATKLVPLIRNWPGEDGGSSILGTLGEVAGGGSSSASGSIVADPAQVVEVSLDPVPLADTARAATGGGATGGGATGGGTTGGGTTGGGTTGGGTTGGGIVLRPPPIRQAHLPAVLAYAWGNSPSDASYTPSASYFYSSSGGAGSVQRTGVGAYRLQLAGLGQSAGQGGNVQVTGYGPGAGRCQVQGWGGAGSAGFTTVIRCSDHAGQPQDAQFSALAFWSLGGGKTGYVWNNNPMSASYAPAASYAYNSAGGPVSIARVSAGVYRVTFGRLGDPQQGGNVQVVSYGGAGEHCKVASWDSGGADFVANVRCFGADGRPSDRQFSALVTSAAPTSMPVAYAWVDNPSAASSTPDPRYAFNSAGGGATAVRRSVGSYTVSFPKLGSQRGGNVQVTAYGGGNETCKVVSWNAAATSFSANVSCWSAAGQAADTRFSILVLR